MSSGASTASARGPSRDKQGSCFLGCAELRLAGDGIEGIAPDEVEAGWWVTEDRRNDGVATEAMEAAIDDLFSRTDVETITAYISDRETEHPGAWQPSSDLGARPRPRRWGEPMTVYTLPRDDWLRRRPEASARRKHRPAGPACSRSRRSLTCEPLERGEAGFRVPLAVRRPECQPSSIRARVSSRSRNQSIMSIRGWRLAIPKACVR